MPASINRDDLTEREHAFCQELAEIDIRIGRWAAEKLRAGANLSTVRAGLQTLVAIADKHYRR